MMKKKKQRYKKLSVKDIITEKELKDLTEILMEESPPPEE